MRGANNKSGETIKLQSEPPKKQCDELPVDRYRPFVELLEKNELLDNLIFETVSVEKFSELFSVQKTDTFNDRWTSSSVTMIDAIDTKSGESVRIRQMDQNKISPHEVQLLNLELKSKHPNIITWKLYDVGPRIYLVRPKLQRLTSNDVPLPEKVVCHMIYQLLMAISHSPNTLKTDKIYTNKECTKFYFRSELLCVKQESFRTCGSSSTGIVTAPEVLCGKSYQKAEVAMWDIGHNTFYFLSGDFPFYVGSTAASYTAILTTTFSFKNPLWNEISDHAKNFIQALLAPCETRAYVSQALQSPWFSHFLNFQLWSPQIHKLFDSNTQQTIYIMLLVNQRLCLISQDCLYYVFKFLAPPVLIPLEKWYK